jgi:hypothetical protein
MTVATSRWWSKHKLAYISLALALTGLLILGSTLGFLEISKQPASHFMLNLVDTAALMALGSFGFAVASLIADSDRSFGILAVIVATGAVLTCFSQVPD